MSDLLLKAAMSVHDKIVEILADQALIPASEISPEATLENLGIDSINLVEIIFAIEESFDIEVPFNANEPDATEFDISSVASIVKAVEALIAGKGD